MAANDSSSVAILSARGVFYKVTLDDSQAPGLYAVAGLNRPDPSAVIPVQPTAAGTPGNAKAADPSAVASSNAFPILISGIATTQNDIVSQVSCLENVKILYTFGQNFGQLIIRGEVLMGPAGEIKKQAVQQLEDYFWKYRVSTRGLPVMVSIADNAFYAYLVGMEIHDVMTDFHILPFVLYGVLLDLSRSTSSLINPKALVLTGGNLTSSSVQNALSQRKSALAVPSVTGTDSTAPLSLLDGPTAAGGATNSASFAAQQAQNATNNPQNTPAAGPVKDPMVPVRTAQAEGKTLTPDQQTLNQMVAFINSSNTGQNANTDGLTVTPKLPSQVTTFITQSPAVTNSNTDQEDAGAAAMQAAGSAVLNAYNSTSPSPLPVAKGNTAAGELVEQNMIPPESPTKNVFEGLTTQEIKQKAGF